MSDVTETDYTTNPPTIVERKFTPEELAQLTADLLEQEILDAEQAAKEKAIADAITHAKSLGFTDAMIAVMYPNLGDENVTN